MNKICPFCKKSIGNSLEKCPHCRRVIVERTGETTSIREIGRNGVFQKIHNSYVNSVKRFKAKLGNLFRMKKRYFPIKLKYIGVGAILLFFFLIFGLNISTDENLPSKNYNSLPNGTVLSSMLNDSGDLGNLEIDNGTDYDAVAKLIDEQASLSVFTVYVQAKSGYTITNISDGAYKLYFMAGKDWDEKGKHFIVDRSFAKFRENFSYTTTSTELFNEIRTRYSVYQVTLNPVVGGTAKTDNIAEAEFTKY